MTTRPATSLDPSRAVATPSWSLQRWLGSRPSPTPGITHRPAASASPLAARSALALTRPTDLPDGFSLRGLLVCVGCDQPLRPVITPAGARGYHSACGCRPDVVDATVVERLVRDVVERHSVALVNDVPPAALGEVFRALFAVVRVGGSAEELSPIWRF